MANYLKVDDLLAAEEVVKNAVESSDKIVYLNNYRNEAIKQVTNTSNFKVIEGGLSTATAAVTKSGAFAGILAKIPWTTAALSIAASYGVYLITDKIYPDWYSKFKDDLNFLWTYYKAVGGKEFLATLGEGAKETIGDIIDPDSDYEYEKEDVGLVGLLNYENDKMVYRFPGIAMNTIKKGMISRGWIKKPEPSLQTIEINVSKVYALPNFTNSLEYIYNNVYKFALMEGSPQWNHEHLVRDFDRLKKMMIRFKEEHPNFDETRILINVFVNKNAGEDSVIKGVVIHPLFSVLATSRIVEYTFRQYSNSYADSSTVEEFSLVDPYKNPPNVQYQPVESYYYAVTKGYIDRAFYSFAFDDPSIPIEDIDIIYTRVYTRNVRLEKGGADQKVDFIDGSDFVFTNFSLDATASDDPLELDPRIVNDEITLIDADTDISTWRDTNSITRPSDLPVEYEDGTLETYVPVTPVPMPGQVPLPDGYHPPLLDDEPGVLSPNPAPNRKPSHDVADQTIIEGSQNVNGSTPTPPNPLPTPTPVIPPPSQATSMGMLALYNPTLSEVKDFSRFLWSSDFLDVLAKLFTDPIEAIVGFHLMYTKPQTGERDKIRVGYIDSPVESAVITSQYTEIDCGTVDLYEYFQNALDYAPYTTCEIYLPFVGFQAIPLHDFMNGKIRVKYIVDAMTGAFACSVYSIKNNIEQVKMQFSGSCSVQLPITSGSWISVMSSLVSLGVSAVGTVANPAAGAIGIVQSIANFQPADIKSSGAMTSNAGAMSYKKPFILINRPISAMPTAYQKVEGYPSSTSGLLRDFKGLTKVSGVNLDGIDASSDLKDMIKNALKEGVIV